MGHTLLFLVPSVVVFPQLRQPTWADSVVGVGHLGMLVVYIAVFTPDFS